MEILAKQSNPAMNGQHNIGHLCTRQLCDAGYGTRVAVRWVLPNLEIRDVTFSDLELTSNQVANLLTRLGCVPGDRVFTFLPRSSEIFDVFLGALKVQAIAGVLFSNFGEEALYDRLSDSAARFLFTKKSLLRKVKSIWAGLPQLEKVIVTDLSEDESERVLSYRRLVETVSSEYSTPITPPETPSVLHYTSGSTGKPKGVLHRHQSIFSQADTFNGVLGVQKGDIYWCTADPGWVTGVSYGIIGPLSQGVTQIQFAGSYSAEAWFKILQDQRVNVWYTAPTALRMLMQEVSAFYKEFDLQALRHIFSVGEPLNPAVIEWGRRVLDRDIYDTWFQTETGAIMISNRPGLLVKPGSMGKPYTAEAAILDPKWRPVEPGAHGRLCLKAGWPSMFITYLNKQTQYEAKFHDGYYDSGDMAYQDSEGYVWFVGRGDDVINTAGHLVGPFEIESALLEMDEVAEAGVIGAPDEMFFEKIVAFVRLKNGVEWTREIEVKLRLYVSNKVSSIATPQEIKVVDIIPKNKSGKIMRRVLKCWYTGEDPGDLSTLED